MRQISAAYRQSDDDRYLLERSLQISSDEMQALLQQQRATAEGRMQALVNALPDLVFMLDQEGRYVEVIAGDEAGLYLPADALKGRLLSEIVGPEQARFFLDVIRRALESMQLQVVEYQLNLKGGRRRYEGRVVATGLKVNGLHTVLFLARDVTELARSRDELQYMATHDELTGLPNRALLEGRLALAVVRAERSQRCGALMVIDLDNFKQINDSLGHHNGDRLLQRLVQRFKRVFRLEDTVIRFGGDEFVVIAEDLSTPADAEKIAGHVLDAFTAPVSLENIDLVVTASIGIALFPLDARDGSELLRHADSAMYLSKAAGRNQYSFYTQDLGSEALEYVELGSLLSRAIANRELVLHYQPQLYLQSGELAGVEALVRWPGAGCRWRSKTAHIWRIPRSQRGGTGQGEGWPACHGK
ncbi:MAG: diguanylate cyclase [gamma proteobacterium symbiont of Phacoides pectinatus]